MKKKLAIIVLIILAILLVVFIRGKKINKEISYELETVEVYNYVKYMEDNKYGVMDRNGNIILNAEFSKIDIPNPEKDIFVCYKDNEKSKVLNSKKDVMFEKYDDTEPIKLKNIASTLCFEKSVLKYEKDGLYGLVDFNGKEITKNEYNSIENLQSTEGKFLVSKNNKYGVINLNGTQLVDIKYDKVLTDEYYSEENKYEEAGFIVSNTTENGYRYGYIDYKGNSILNVEYGNIIRIAKNKDIYLIAAKNGKYGLYKNKKEVIKPEYQEISYTDNGAIIIEKNGVYGIANLNGEIKVETKYNKIEENGIYLYAESPNENSVYNKDGEKININFSKSVYDTENEEYKVTTLINNDIIYYGIENKEGKELLNSNYKYIEYAYESYFIAEDENDKYGVINANGKIEIEFKYELIQQIKGKNIIQAEKNTNSKIEFYNKSLEKITEINSARVENKINYAKIYNDKEEIFLDIEGKELQKNSEIIQKELEKELPNQIGDYKKVQYSLDDAYYIKQ